MNKPDRIQGAIIGTAVGDAIGLPYEGLNKKRANKFIGPKLRHKLLFGKGMVSDDTDHTVFVVEALLSSNNEKEFITLLSRKLKAWLLAFPAGIGMATLKSIIKLFFISPYKSGVFSAGNGPAMRSAPIGLKFYIDLESLKRYAEINTRITHTDVKAYTGSLSIALLTAWILRDDISVKPKIDDFTDLLITAGYDDEWTELTAMINESLRKDISVEEFAIKLGLENGITGYIYYTVPMALYSWHKNFNDFKGALEDVIRCGGDTDTTGAVLGAIMGAAVGVNGIPKEWIDNIVDRPHGISYLYELSDRLNNDAKGEFKIRNKYFTALLRNAFFTTVVLLHGFRRLLPPY